MNNTREDVNLEQHWERERGEKKKDGSVRENARFSQNRQLGTNGKEQNTLIENQAGHFLFLSSLVYWLKK